MIATCIFALTVLLGHAQEEFLPEKDDQPEVCYPMFGCFNSQPPFHNADGRLPQNPAHVGTKFLLYTRSNQKQADDLVCKQAWSISQSHFNSDRPTKVIIHGFLNSEKTQWVIDMTEALLKHGDYNVIVVDWSKGSSSFAYAQAVANVRLVATQLKTVLQLLQRLAGLRLTDVHLIGHSLGSHVSGYAGTLLGGIVGRITGLDPADPGFSKLPQVVRLDKGDARFVDVMHTDGGKYKLTKGYGLLQQSGHVDFYMNGGEKQPGCKVGFAGLYDGCIKCGGFLNTSAMIEAAGDGLTCSHSRAHMLFVESINSPCRLRSFPCENYSDFLDGKCQSCGTSGCSEVGFSAGDFPTARGKQYAITFYKSPFCGDNYYQISIRYGPSQKLTQGEVYVRLLGIDSRMVESTRNIGLIGNNQVSIGRDNTSTVIVLDKSLKELGQDYMVELLYLRKAGRFSFLSRASFTLAIERLRIIEFSTGQTLLTEKKIQVLNTGRKKMILLSKAAITLDE